MFPFDDVGAVSIAPAIEPTNKFSLTTLYNLSVYGSQVEKAHGSYYHTMTASSDNFDVVPIPVVN